MPTVTRAVKPNFDNTEQETPIQNESSSIKTESILNCSSEKIDVSEKQEISNVNINKFNTAHAESLIIERATPKSDVESSNDAENESVSSDDSINHRLTKPEQLYQDLLAIGAGEYIEKSEKENRPGFTGKKTGYRGFGNCFLAGVFRGHIEINAKNGVAELDRVIHEDECLCCNAKVKFTIRDCLSQKDYGGYNYGEGPAKCTTNSKNCAGEGQEIGYFLTGLCEGNFQLDSGESHHHCMECPGFGKCSGDYRAHYFGMHSYEDEMRIRISDRLDRDEDGEDQMRLMRDDEEADDGGERMRLAQEACKKLSLQLNKLVGSF